MKSAWIKPTRRSLTGAERNILDLVCAQLDAQGVSYSERPKVLRGRGSFWPRFKGLSSSAKPQGSSKRALTGLVQTAALEYGERGIRVNAICPGTTDTEMVRRLANLLDAPDGVAVAALNAWAQSNVAGMKRMASSEEMATAILAMASPEMGYMNGSMVIVDGGMSSAL